MPGSIIAARELYKQSKTAVENKRILILGAGVGLEAQAAAMLGAEYVLATDIHPTTLQQLEYGVLQESRIKNKTIVQTQLFDIYSNSFSSYNEFDLLIIADVLYNKELATQVCYRIKEALRANPKIRILLTDSQRFVPSFLQTLQECSLNTSQKLEWKEETLEQFTGSGVCIDEDQTYDIAVRTLWIGL